MSSVKLGKNNPMFGKFHSEKTKQAISESLIGNKNSSGTSGRPMVALSNRKRKDKSQPKTQCPNCDKIGSISNMRRWHFSNCKSKVA